MCFCTQTICVFRLVRICVRPAYAVLSFGTFSASVFSSSARSAALVALTKEHIEKGKWSRCSDIPRLSAKQSTALGHLRDSVRERGKTNDKQKKKKEEWPEEETATSFSCPLSIKFHAECISPINWGMNKFWKLFSPHSVSLTDNKVLASLWDEVQICMDELVKLHLVR